MTPRFRATGLPKMLANIRAEARETVDRTAAALRAEHELILSAAKDQTPVDTGALRGTGHVEPTVREGGRLVSRGGLGGPAAPYAVFVHEDLEAHHTVGNAKFYERPFLAAQSGMAERIAAAVRKG